MAALKHPQVMEILPEAQSYDWGTLGKDGSTVAKLAQASNKFQYDENKPYAELWMGTHPSLPSRLLANNQTLGEYISSNLGALGDKVRSHFGDDLPFLFKVLAIGKALSIQAHPDKALAERLHRDRPNIYKDGNHKPEMAIAITPFSGFCGFRPLPEISQFLASVPEFAAVVGPSAASAFASAVPASGSAPAFIASTQGSQDDVSRLQKLLRDLFTALMTADSELVKTQVRALVARVLKEEPKKAEQFGTLEELIVRLDRQFPDDVGVFCAFMLNVVELQPGQAAFLKANEPHAYLTGDIVECMATSDNVVRAGLTPKLRDVPTLTSMLTYTYGPASTQLMQPAQFRGCRRTTVYDPPIEEFAVLLTDLAEGDSDVVPAVQGPSIVVVTEGKGTIKVGEEGNAVQVERTGQVFFIVAGAEVELLADKGAKFVSYRAFVEAP